MIVPLRLRGLQGAATLFRFMGSDGVAGTAGAGTGAFREWAEAYRRFDAGGSALLWPSETLVRLFRGPYVPEMPRDLAGKRVLDVGFGNGNNLPFYHAIGLTIAGVEVSGEICRETCARLAAAGIEADLREGENRRIPFEDATFDFLVAWNVIHYEGEAGRVREGLAEYRRVLAPGGRLFLSTAGPEHKILEGGERLDGHRVRIGREDDFRKGQVYWYFGSEECLAEILGGFFVEVRTGRTHDRLLTETLDLLIATGVRPACDA